MNPKINDAHIFWDDILMHAMMLNKLRNITKKHVNMNPKINDAHIFWDDILMPAMMLNKLRNITKKQKQMQSYLTYQCGTIVQISFYTLLPTLHTETADR